MVHEVQPMRAILEQMVREADVAVAEVEKLMG